MWKLSARDKDWAAEQYQAGMSSVAIAAILDVNPRSVRGVLARRGIPRRSNAQSHTVHSLREAAFDELSSDAAYWAGFIAADGSLGVRGTGSPFLAVAIAERDRDHLLALREFLGSTHALTPVARRPHEPGGPLVRYSVRSGHLHARLTALGVRGPQLDPALARSADFWRGVVDGDGWVGGDVTKPRLELVGYPYVLEPFVAFLSAYGIPEPSVHTHKTICRVSVSGSCAVQALRVIYPPAAACGLARKCQAAAAVITHAPARPGSVALGEVNGNARLTVSVVHEIRRRYMAGGTSHRRLAAQFSVSPSTVGQIVRGETWTTT